MKNSIFYIISFIILCFLNSSCKSSPFARIEDFSKLNGKFYSKSERIDRNKNREYTHILRLFNVKENIEDSYYLNLKFEEPNKIHISYPIQNKDSIITQNQSFTTKRKKKFLEIYFDNTSVGVPLILHRENIDRLRIGINKQGNLLLEKYQYIGGNILIFGSGFGYPAHFAFYNYDDYKDLKPFYKNGKYGVLKDNKIIVEPIYDLTNIFERNYIKIKQNNKYGILDNNGKEIIPPKYDEITSIDYPSFFFYVKKNGKYGVVNIDGKEIIKPKYDRITAFNEEAFELELENKYGLFFFNNNTLYPTIYDKIGLISLSHKRYLDAENQYIGVKRNGNEYIIDKEGYEYKPNRKFPTFILTLPVPLLETKTKVSQEE